ncbi:Undecaprenyl-phosphate alpha-N-acetylglucosaminyl 1-phosphate transferase [Vibrio stylophorae]|uniref:Undecaprenyl-phosphate alpha-N-acetylglucosaminyl 1-phosphate transferase n=1 Tax=Vibrio stylophorae TaxID=659351 RepID=A0ABN8DT66_9VIBR|nr:UDP-N-acetylglucosamine--undecaprenyl-phosphate N-acetylglucosaminephosphotransferase [Vibrio stylophorae]CAH0534279.1 Undecaprenyl-phosphate alpha-N-acetylglucosaminyl 1-phosphate transferase [Vibrio stylophorae]
MLLELLFVGCFSFCSLVVMRKFAKQINLVDKPNSRKLHTGAIPLIGGISIYMSIGYFLAARPDIIQNNNLFLSCLGILITLGAIDDKMDISFKVRLAVQAIVSILMIQYANIELDNIGNVLGTGEIRLGFLSPVITILAVIGAINAFNMVDGIDGLLGTLSIVTFASLAIVLRVDGQSGLAYLCLIFIVATLPYILMNLGIFGPERKVFMGDAGSMMIGFTVIWLLLGASQNQTGMLLRPVTALWLIAIPLMDMAAIMIRRVKRGDSPFKPDREHLHHIFQRLGFSSKQTLVIISSLASTFAMFGIYGEISGISERTMFMLFIICFMGYTTAMSYSWRMTTWMRRRKGLSDSTL